jgi:type I restriction enzyme S subunit
MILGIQRSVSIDQAGLRDVTAPFFSHAWEQRKLTEIVNRVNKSSNSDVLPKVEFEDIVSGEGRLNKDISSKFDSRKGTLFEPENILYGKLRPYLKNWLFPEFEGVALGDFWVFEATDVSVPSFDYYLIQSDNYQKVANDTSGTKMPRSDWKSISSTDFAIPSKDEQKQIGAFFKQLDDTITLHQRKLSHLRELKRGLLQKMFAKSGEDRPEVRFPGFADAWEQRKLGDIADVVGGGTPDTGNPDYWNGDIDWYAPAEIGESVFVSESQRKITTLGLRKSSAKMLPPGTILFTSRAGIGNTAILAVSACTNQGFQSIVPHPEVADSYFIFARSSQLKRYGEKVGAGSTFVEVSGKQMSKMPLRVPVLQEQCRIGTLFRQIDDLITLHQRKQLNI